MPAEIRNGVVTVGGVRSPYIQAGPPAAEAAVFVHGNPGSFKDWRDLVGRVGEFGHALALDMPGFGSADKPKEFDYSVPGYARHLDGALTQLGVERAHLVLHDFGGPWGLEWASAHTDRVGSFTFINMGVLLGYRWHTFARIWRTPVLGELSMATTSRAAYGWMMRRTNPRLPQAYIDQMYDDFGPDTRRAVLKLYRATPRMDRDAERFAAALRPLDLPALVLWGRRDPFIGPEFAEVQRQTFPRARIVMLDDCAHWPFAEEPETVAAAAVPFLREQMTGALPA